jgi:hypothetical protein
MATFPASNEVVEKVVRQERLGELAQIQLEQARNGVELRLACNVHILCYVHYEGGEVRCIKT